MMPDRVLLVDWVALSAAVAVLKFTLVAKVAPETKSVARTPLPETATTVAVVRFPAVPSPTCKVPALTVVAPV